LLNAAEESEEKMADADGYAKLIMAIIKQAVVDAKRELRSGTIKGFSASLFLKSDEFIDMCHLIDCDGEVIRSKVLSKLEEMMFPASHAD